MKKHLILVLFTLSILLSGCVWLDEQALLGEEPLEPVTLKLKWVHQAQFAGNYVAEEKGFYEDKGLDVTIEEFSYEKPTIDAVTNGDADFGITSASELLLARAEGKPLKAIAVIFKTNPDCVYSLKESGIETPYDLIGKTVGLEKGASPENYYYLMMEKLAIDRSQINEVYIGYDATELLAGEVDASTGYIINEPHQAIEAGYEVNTILMADYGVKLYGDVLFATEETIENNPELVQNFLDATLDGWVQAIENQEETTEIVLEYATDRTYSHEYYMLNQEIPFIHTGDTPLGWMEQVEWESVEQNLFDLGQIKEEIDVQEAHCMQFLEVRYS